MQGWGAPAYTDVIYPFPVEPPNVRDENPTGEYRAAHVPPWMSHFPGGAAVLRFDGVDSAIHRRGATESNWAGRRAAGWRTEFDVECDDLGAGEETWVAVRVQQWSASQLPGGPGHVVAVRDLPSRWRCSPDPNKGLDDAFVHADYDAASGHGRL